MTHTSRGPVVLAVLAAVLLNAGCKDEEIPTLAPGPYLLSNIRITKDARPPYGSRLTPGSNVLLRYSVAYTLDQGEFTNRGNLRLFINFFGSDSVGSLVGIGGFPDRELGITKAAGILPDSLSITVPTGIRFVTMEAFLDTLPFANPVIAIDAQDWIVQ